MRGGNYCPLPESALDAQLAAARAVLDAAAGDGCADDAALPEALEALRWFTLPTACLG